MKKGNHFDNARALLSFLIIVVGFGIFLLFYVYKDYIIQSNSFYTFMTLTVFGMAFMLGLLYLVNNSSHPSKKIAAPSKTKKAKKKSR